MIDANGVQLCTEPFGDPADPPILLIARIGSSSYPSSSTTGRNMEMSSRWPTTTQWSTGEMQPTVERGRTGDP